VASLVEGVYVRFQLALFVGRSVFVNDSFGCETVQVSFDVIEEVFRGGFVVHRLELLNFRADAAFPGLILFASLLILPHSLLGRLVLGHGEWGIG